MALKNLQVQFWFLEIKIIRLNISNRILTSAEKGLNTAEIFFYFLVLPGH